MLHLIWPISKFSHCCSPIGRSGHGAVRLRLHIIQPPRVTRWKLDFGCEKYYGIEAFLNDIEWLGSFNFAATVNEMYEMFLAGTNEISSVFNRNDKKAFDFWYKARHQNTNDVWESYGAFSGRTDKALKRHLIYIEKVVESGDITKFCRCVGMY